jgi:hypothetical protein
MWGRARGAAGTSGRPPALSTRLRSRPAGAQRQQETQRCRGEGRAAHARPSACGCRDTRGCPAARGAPAGLGPRVSGGIRIACPLRPGSGPVDPPELRGGRRSLRLAGPDCLRTGGGERQEPQRPRGGRTVTAGARATGRGGTPPCRCTSPARAAARPPRPLAVFQHRAPAPAQPPPAAPGPR